MADDAPQRAAAAASAAVAAGALLAGAVLKRSEWLKRWNPRFAVLTTEQLYYYHSASPTGGVGERRAILLTAGMTVSACDGGLALSCVPPFHFRCSSDAELRVWAQELKSLLGALREEARAARLCVRENAALFSAPPFVEHPHAGSRNLRERRLAKTFYTCAPANERAGKRGDATVLLSVMVLPPLALAWSADECRAFHGVLASMATSRTASRFLLPPLHAELQL